jgi:hypothetical protein
MGIQMLVQGADNRFGAFVHVTVHLDTITFPFCLITTCWTCRTYFRFTDVTNSLRVSGDVLLVLGVYNVSVLMLIPLLGLLHRIDAASVADVSVVSIASIFRT